MSIGRMDGWMDREKDEIAQQSFKTQTNQYLPSRFIDKQDQSTATWIVQETYHISEFLATDEH